MYQVGQGQGQTYVAPEGNGFSSIVGTPKSDQAGLWIAQKKAEKAEKEQAATKLERQKALGMMDDIKADAFQPHYTEIQSDLGTFYDKVAKDMINLNNPFDLRDPRGAENMKKLTQIKAKIALSKNMQNEFDMFERGDHKDIDPKSVEAKRQQMLKTPLQDWADGKVEPVKLTPKNPYDSQDAIFGKYVKEKSAQYEKNGLDLVDDPKAIGEIVGDVLQNDKNAQQFYQTYFDSLPEEKKKGYQDKAMQYAKNGTPKTPFEVMATEHLESTLPRTPVDYDKFLKEAVNVGDVVSEGGGQTGTWESKNSKKAVMPKIKDLAKSQLIADPKALKFVVEKFGIKETDPTKQLAAAVEQVAKDKYNTLDVKSGSRQYKLTGDEKAEKGFGDWMDRVYNGNYETQREALGYLVGDNKTLGAEIKSADIVRTPNSETPYSVKIKFDNQTDIARFISERRANGGYDNLSAEDKSLIDEMSRNAIGNEVTLPANAENSQKFLGLFQGTKREYKPTVKKQKYDPLDMKKSTNSKTSAKDPLGLR